MAAHGSPESRASVLRSLVLLERLLLDLSRDAESVLSASPAASLDMELLHCVRRTGGISPSQLVEQVGRPRSSVARGLARLLQEGLLVRARCTQDARQAELRLSPAGKRSLKTFVAASTDTITRSETNVEEVLHLLGRDPQWTAERSRVPDVLAALDQLTEARSAFAHDLRPALRVFDLDEAVDRGGLLVVAEGRQARPTHMAHELGLTPPGVTSLLDRLESKGLVERDLGIASDGRAVLVRLTPRGRRAVRAYISTFRHHQANLLDAIENIPAISRL